MKINDIIKKYDYNLPKKLIAQKPACPRDSARLLVYRKSDGKIYYDIFKNIGKYLPKNSVLVFNQTKVIPARIEVVKPTGGKAELLYLGHNKKHIKVLSNKKLQLKTIIAFSNNSQIMRFRVLKGKKGEYDLKPLFPINQINAFLIKCGKTPLPPYMKASLLSEKQKRIKYQSVFAKNGESVAAPTASLHFTKKLLFKLKQQGIKIEFINLNIGLGTFASLNENNFFSNKLHKEYFQIKKNTLSKLNKYKKERRPIIAVGTTSVRTLESSSNNKRVLKILSGNTRIFIKPGYNFNFIDGMITNFHVPKSSLMMLVSAFIGKISLLNLYKKAISKKFHFFSFGDGMLILP